MLDDHTRLEFPGTGLTRLALHFELHLLRCQAAGPGGRALSVLLDTGTDPSAMDAGLAHRLAVQTGGSGLGRGAASDTVQFTEAVLPWLRLGNLTIRNLFAPAVDLSGLPFQVDVVLGYNVLRQISLRVDYRGGWLTLAHPDLGAPPVSAQGALLRMDFFEHFPALRDLQIDGRHIPLATLDTGSNSALTLGPDLAAQLGLQDGAQDVRQTHGAGFGGGVGVIQRFCRAVQIGPFSIPDVELDAPGGVSGDLGRAGRANIGNRLLSRFAGLALDYERQLIALEPDAAATE